MSVLWSGLVTVIYQIWSLSSDSLPSMVYLAIFNFIKNKKTHSIYFKNDSHHTIGKTNKLTKRKKMFPKNHQLWRGG